MTLKTKLKILTILFSFLSWKALIILWMASVHQRQGVYRTTIWSVDMNATRMQTVLKITDVAKVAVQWCAWSPGSQTEVCDKGYAARWKRGEGWKGSCITTRNTFLKIRHKYVFQPHRMKRKIIICVVISNSCSVYPLSEHLSKLTLLIWAASYHTCKSF